jgi:putative membrane protein
MKRLASAAAGCFILLATASALAQQAPNPSTSEPPYGYYHMWGGDPWGWHAGMIFAPIMMLLIVVGIVALIVLLIRGAGYGSHWHRHGDWPPYGRWQGRGALDILEERFAKGEIDKDEFEEKRKLLGR